MNDISAKKVIIFDLDGTLSESKTPIDDEMAELLGRLLSEKRVAVITGGRYEQMRLQCSDCINCAPHVRGNLFMLPASGTCLYRYDRTWTCVYKEKLLSDADREQIRDALSRSLPESGVAIPETPYGDFFEDHETQVTFSALGQKAPLEAKKPWDPDGAKRARIIVAAQKHIPQFEMRIGGTTTINITQKGVDKAFGIAQIEKHLGFTKPEMLFIGDALFKGGNDYPVKAAGVDSIEIGGPDDTKEVIRRWLY